MKQFEKIKSKTLFALCLKVSSALVSFFSVVVITRYLGIEQSGYYFLAYSIISILAVVSRVGLDNTVLRFTGAAVSEKNYPSIRGLMNKSMGLALLGSSFIGLLGYISVPTLATEVFKQPELINVLKFSMPAIVAISLSTLIGMFFQGIGHIAKTVFLVNIAINLLLIIFLVIFNSSTAKDAAVFLSLSSLLTLFIGLFFCIPYTKYPILYDLEWKTLASSFIPLWVMMTMQQVIQWSGRIIAGAWLPATDVALLAVAQRTALLTSFILMAVNLVIAPSFAALYKKNDMENLKESAIKAMKLTAFFGLFLSAPLFLFPQFFLGIFGDEFASGGKLLRIMVVGQIINVITGPVLMLLSMTGNERYLKSAIIYSAFISVFSGLVLVPTYGVQGAAIATAIAVSTQNILLLMQVNKALGFRIF